MNSARKRKPPVQPVQPVQDGQPRASEPTPPLASPDLHPKPKPGSPIPPEFDHLSPRKLEYIHDRLLTHPYADVQALIFAEFGIEISINKLFRYYQKIALARLLEIPGTPAEAASQLQKLYNGQPVQLNQAGLETIQRRALELAISPSTSPSLLLNLMRIFTWDHRQSMDEHRRKIDSEKSTHRNRMAEIAERHATVAERHARCEEQRVEILQRHQAYLEKNEDGLAWPQNEINRFIDPELRYSEPDDAAASNPPTSPDWSTTPSKSKNPTCSASVE